MTKAKSHKTTEKNMEKNTECAENFRLDTVKEKNKKDFQKNLK